MTDKFAFTLFMLICAGVAADYFLFGADHLIFLGKKFFALTDWLAFWR